MYLLLANLFGSTTLFWYFGTSNFSIPHSTLFSVVNLMRESLRVELSNRNIVSFSRGSVMWLLWQVWSAHEVLSLWIFTRLTVCEPYCVLDNSSLYILYNTEITFWFFVWLVFFPPLGLQKFHLWGFLMLLCAHWNIHIDQTSLCTCFLTLCIYFFMIRTFLCSPVLYFLGKVWRFYETSS